ncbi:MAG TPA: hypothetical protein VFV25_08290 [Methylibium sp.]
MTPWHQYWTHWMELAREAPEEVARRADLITRAPGSPLSLADSQRVLWENWTAATESWWSWWKAAHTMQWPTMPWPPAGVVPPPEEAPAAPAPAPAAAAPAPKGKRVSAAPAAPAAPDPALKARVRRPRHR